MTIPRMTNANGSHVNPQDLSLKVAILGDYPLDPERMTGGVESVIGYLVPELSKFPDLELHVITLREVVQKHIRQNGNVSLHYLPASYRFGNVTFFAVNRLRLLRELNGIQPDLIHAHIAGPYAEVAYWTGRPTVLTQHGIRHRSEWLDHGWLNRWVRRPLIAREETDSIRQARHLIAISPYICREYEGVIRGTVYPIENPVADKFFQVPDRPQEGRILYAGRIDGNKSLHHLIQALAQVRKHVPTAHVHVAGPSDDDLYWPHVQATVRDLGLQDHVHFLGHLPEPGLLEEYERCALLVLPSRQETSPMVIQQAMAAGKPVVATRVGGIPYLVAHGETGFVFDYGDIAGLAQSIEDVLTKTDLRKRMSERARQEASQRFRAEVVARQTYQVYRTIVSQSRRR